MLTILKYPHATKIHKKTVLPFSSKKNNQVYETTVTEVSCSIGYEGSSLVTNP